MKANDLSYYNFDAELNDESVIECPFCKADSCIADWSESEFYCEDCSDYHNAIACPACLCSFDHIMPIGVKKIHVVK